MNETLKSIVKYVYFVKDNVPSEELERFINNLKKFYLIPNSKEGLPYKSIPLTNVKYIDVLKKMTLNKLINTHKSIFGLFLFIKNKYPYYFNALIYSLMRDEKIILNYSNKSELFIKNNVDDYDYTLLFEGIYLLFKNLEFNVLYSDKIKFLKTIKLSDKYDTYIKHTKKVDLVSNYEQVEYIKKVLSTNTFREAYAYSLKEELFNKSSYLDKISEERVYNLIKFCMLLKLGVYDAIALKEENDLTRKIISEIIAFFKKYSYLNIKLESTSFRKFDIWATHYYLVVAPPQSSTPSKKFIEFIIEKDKGKFGNQIL